MGHYASEMRDDSDKAAKLRKKYNKVRKALENAAVSRFSLIEFMKVQQLLSDQQTPRDFEKRSEWYVLDRINDIKKLLSITK